MLRGAARRGAARHRALTPFARRLEASAGPEAELDDELLRETIGLDAGQDDGEGGGGGGRRRAAKAGARRAPRGAHFSNLSEAEKDALLAAHPWSALDICEAYAAARGYRLNGGVLDSYRAANEILHQVLSGELLLCFAPPAADDKQRPQQPQQKQQQKQQQPPRERVAFEMPSAAADASGDEESGDEEESKVPARAEPRGRALQGRQEEEEADEDEEEDDAAGPRSVARAFPSEPDETE